MILSNADVIALERDVCRAELFEFAQRGWGNVEARPLVPNWHMGAICEHLEAVSYGELRRIIINVPPRHSKSLLTNVFWPSWDWLHNSWRTFLFSTYRASLSERDNKKAKRLVESEWYQARFEPRIDPLNNTNARWGIKRGGERLISSVAGASSTGEGGDIIVIDDPISADGARHPAQRRAVLDWWDDTIKSRFNDARKGAFVIIMQRLHEEDLTGHILANETGWDHLCLPARYEPDHIYPVVSSIGFKDPRTKAGEILNPSRFGEQELSEIAKPGTYTEAGQLQQRPAPREGGMFERKWFEIIPAAPPCTRWVRAWDLAASDEKDSAYTAGIKLGLTGDGTYIIAHAIRFQETSGKVEMLMRNTASQDGVTVPGSIPQDPGAGGKAWARSIIKALRGFPYRATPESGDKVARAEPVSAQAEIGNIKIVKGPWNEDLLAELELFPNSKFKDQVDALSRAFDEVTNGKQTAVSTSYG